MASVAAREVALEVLETIGRGKRPNLSEIAIKKGYSPTTAKAGLVKKTLTYQRELAPLVASLELERDQIIKRMRRIRNQAKYRDLVDAFDKITKNIQLLTGGATSNVALSVHKLKDDELERLATGS